MARPVTMYVLCLPNISPFAIQKVQKLNFRGPELWVDRPLSPCRAGAMLSSKQLQLGGGDCHESATGATGQGAPWPKRLGDHHGARRRCGTPYRSDDHDGLAGGLGPAYPAPLEATGA